MCCLPTTITQDGRHSQIKSEKDDLTTLLWDIVV